MLTKFQARAFFLGGTAVFTGIFLILTIDTHRQVPEQTNDSSITPQVAAGKKLWEQNNCMGCHTLFGEGAYYAPELTKVVDRRGRDWIKVFMKDPEAMFPGQRKMVKYEFTDQEIGEVIAFLEWCGKVDLNGFPAEPPLKKLMQPDTGTMASASGELPASVAATVALPPMFEQKSCTGCHRILGKGTPGVMLPNAVTGEVVPAPALDLVHQRKTREELIAWISDPQKVKPGSPMPKLTPALVSPQEVEQMVDFLLSLKAHTPTN
ncbi:MAG: cytochrome c [Verrucomicrobiales bacterium]|nr:cytochrome c [Verrucomicrobiales bacterium]